MKITKESVAHIVSEHIKDRHPGGITLEVVEEDIHKVDNWWRVPVRPSAWPVKRYAYYEELAEIESDIQENEHLDILISTGVPESEEQAA